MISLEKTKELEEIARDIRRKIVEMIGTAGSGHPGGSLSATDIIVALYFHVMKHDPKNPKWNERDRFVLSKGHAAPALYAVLATAGYFPVEILNSLRKIDSILQGHPDMRKVPGIEISSGALGQGLSVANGIALAGKIDKMNYKVYVLIGDGESDEGGIWEGAMFASHYKLDNLTAILDRNMMQIDGYTEDVMSLEPLADKWKAFGWQVIEIDGNSMKEIIHALTQENIKGKPKMIIAHTIKGKGVSFMEGNIAFHGKAPTKEEMKKALLELEK
ncbi:MAG: transketolase [Candidatus Thermoplasmatota archaeon]